MRLLVLVFLFVAEAGRAASNAPVAAKNGMVVTAQEQATRIGVEVLRNGGNAIDAAVAVGLRAGRGVSGGRQSRWRRLHDAAARRRAQDLHRLSRDRAARGHRRRCTSTRNGNVIPDRSTRGYLAVAVPGTVSGLEYARAKYGTHGARAVDRAGHHASPSEASCSRRVMSTCCTRPPTTFRSDQRRAAIFLDRDQPFEAGATLRPARPRANAAQHQPARRRRLLQRRDRRRADRRQPRRQGHPHAGRSRRVPHPRACCPSNATTAAFTSSPRRRRAPAASCCAKCSISSRAIR